MPLNPTRSLASKVYVFAAAAMAALAFALATGRVWEDYYITYRISKNLALGHGLVYTVGERVHAFTSPLGTLLPALASLLAFNASDLAALWVFRVISIAAFAGAATFLFTTARSLGWGRTSCALLVLWLITDNKSLDFSINGMETGLLLFFLAGTLWALFVSPKSRRWLYLGLGWAGLMWTRPDGFIYIGALTLAAVIFNDAGRSGLTRKQWLKVIGCAALLCTVIYLPWFAWTWYYYGTPVPHTVIAKSTAAGPRSLGAAFEALLRFPVSCFTGNPATDALLMPAYQRFGGWPDALVIPARGIAGISALLWVIPWAKPEARAASLSAFLVMVYLSCYPLHVAPWYLPGPALLTFFALGGALESVLAALATRPRWLTVIPAAAATAWLGCGALMTFQGARLSAVEQELLDGGSRKSIGLWLKDHAAPRDRVFMECLGYIGFYSGLKTYDYPGMSSPEVVRINREHRADWNEIVSRLQPEWVVLRPLEIISMSTGNRAVLRTGYEMTRVFDATDELKRFTGYGRGLLAFDAVFIIFRKTGAASTVVDSQKTSGIPPENRDAVEEAVLRLKRQLGVWAFLKSPESAPGQLKAP